jgi:CDP-glucose 4,6-dehydratase
VAELVQEILKHVPGKMEDKSDPNAPHEAGKLNLTTDKAFHYLGWRPAWNFERTLQETVKWYVSVKTEDAGELTRRQIAAYCEDAAKLNR